MNHRNNKCYAASLEDGCEQKLSREHFFSEAVLEKLADGDGLLTGGFSWYKSQRKLPPNAFASKILCKKHNSYLSTLDTEYLSLYNSLSEIHNHIFNKTGYVQFQIDGIKIERIILKVFFVIFASGGTKQQVNLNLVNPLLRILFGVERFQDFKGLYVPIHQQNPFSNKHTGLTPFIDSQIPTKLLFDFLGFNMILSLNGDEIQKVPTQKLIYRPFYYDFVNSDKTSVARLLIDWGNNPYSKDGIIFKIS